MVPRGVVRCDKKSSVRLTLPKAILDMIKTLQSSVRLNIKAGVRGVRSQLQPHLAFDSPPKSRTAQCNLVVKYFGSEVFWVVSGCIPPGKLMLKPHCSKADVASLSLALQSFLTSNVDPKLPLHIELLGTFGT